MNKTFPKKTAARAQRPSQPSSLPPANDSNRKQQPVRSHKRTKSPAPSGQPAVATRPIVGRKGGSKLDTLLQMIQSKGGASIEQLMKATSWQAHSVRGAISGTLKKKLGLKIVSERVNKARVYRVAK
ncbi:MAG: DUF3489 domain-containing protein [Alphaproteobacteria bacterium]|nr:DUF3489 domain-containing protein [Alphaproteobacteria bacterium]